MHYKAIILVIYNESLVVYKPMKSYTMDYYNLYSKDIKVFYITNREIQNEEIIEEGEFLYVKGTESFTPGIIIKTVKAMDYVNKNYSYDYVVRTNVSTIINCDNMLNYFDTIPKTNYTGGFIIFNTFYSGIFIVFSKDISEAIAGIDMQKERIHEEMDDVLIMQLIKARNIPIYDISLTKYRIEYCNKSDFHIHTDIGVNIEKYENVLCYRVRNDFQRNIIDMQYFDKICNFLSNTTSDNTKS